MDYLNLKLWRKNENYPTLFRHFVETKMAQIFHRKFSILNFLGTININRIFALNYLNFKLWRKNENYPTLFRHLVGTKMAQIFHRKFSILNFLQKISINRIFALDYLNFKLWRKNENYPTLFMHFYEKN